ncbi:ornithine cyclodeaminase family protein [Streptomyces nitrosporeus]|uniref:Ornithine cyclodeaminase family protein n=1 Tax=Streptomyces nitrosporeus TaxID=28894 RepID=A0A5J6F2K0_9ACTN|nr:ornithine cyclodeaminase family protein [Streptomyces nitrosporeus]QEU70628.1 ornithine cyclodeaminase family protein [Streptomyces nitrosporeus]GGZ05779.1 alanine dehydrogenase [Streptomyces nitrosporeus]
MTVLLGITELRQLLTPQAALRALRQGFVSALGTQVSPQRVRQSLPSSPGSIAVLLPGLLTDIPAYTVKVNAKFPDTSPAISGVICLHDVTNGKLLALLDSTFVTAWRTGLSAALATDLLSSDGTRTVGIIGAGAQADMTLRGLTQLRTVKRVVVHDVDGGRAHRMAGLWQQAGLECRLVDSAREVARDCDSIVTATWSRRPLLHLPDLRPGSHITSLGADEPGKAELDAQLLQHARVIVDDLDLAMTSGALGTAGLRREDAAATLGQIIEGTAPARTSAEQVTVYTPVGLPWQDLALSWAAYQAALQHGVGVDFQFHPYSKNEGSI